MAENEKNAKAANMKVFGAKEMIAKHSEANTKIKYGERKEVEIISATKHYAKGQVINPHKIVADRLIEQGIAKEVK